MNSVDAGYSPVEGPGPCDGDKEPSGAIKSWLSLDLLSEYQLLNEGPAPWD